MKMVYTELLPEGITMKFTDGIIYIGIGSVVENTVNEVLCTNV